MMVQVSIAADAMFAAIISELFPAAFSPTFTRT